MAIGIMRGLRDSGIRVPDDVSVVGTNDSPEAEHVTPALTTLRVPYAVMAAGAAELLIDAILQQQPPYGRVTVASELIVRESTARCRRSDYSANGFG